MTCDSSEASLCHPTRLFYLRDGKTLSARSTLLSCQPSSSDPARLSLVLSRTHFYPQGGGQPSDKGVIYVGLDEEQQQQSSFACLIDTVRSSPGGVVYHEGKPRVDGHVDATRLPSTPVEVSYDIDPATRHLHCRLHTAGHVVDVALLHLLALPEWDPVRQASGPITPLKGFHFPEGPNVEFTGRLVFPSGPDPSLSKGKFMEALARVCNDLVDLDSRVIIAYEGPDEEHGQRFGPEEETDDTRKRFVVIEGHPIRMPCGGTHVSRLSDLKRMSIRSIKSSGNTTKIGYDVVPH
jgi:Ser-tRNA(Ala) deacylase AlaX